MRPPRDGKGATSSLSPHRRTECPNRAFVLVSTLLLIGLATILVVTAAMMSRVERKAASNTAKVDQARANALFALDVALNQLQREAGPDQRVTARAEILDTNATTLVTNTVKQPLWTGVWKTGTNGLDIVNSGTPQRQTSLGSITPTMNQKVTNAAWLVSGSGSLDPSSYTGTTNSPGATAAILAKNLGTNATAVEVLAPLVPIVSGTATNGAYAYWVSDEGIKAKVNKTDPTLAANATTDLPKNLLHFVAPQAFAPQKGSTNHFGTNELRSNTNFHKITTLQSLANLAGLTNLAGTNAAKIAGDFTTYSFGVITDVRRGGLKKDLTAAFEDSGTNASANYGKLNPGGTNRVYTAPDDTVGTIASSSYTWTNGNRGLDGLRWLNLYSHYNLYKSATPNVNMFGRTTNSSGVRPLGVGTPDAGSRPYRVAPRGLSWSDTNFSSSSNNIAYGALSPVFLGLRWDVALVSSNTGSDFDLYLRYYPQFVLYNPYSVTITNASNNFRFGRAIAPASGFYLQIGVPATAVVTDTITGVVTTNSGTNYYHAALNLGGLTNAAQRALYNTSFDDTRVLEPGEIRVFGINANIEARLQSTNTNSVNGAASEFKFTNAPYGLVSSAANTYKYALFERINVLTTNTNTPNNPLLDTYTSIPSISGTNTNPITLRITGRPSFVGTGTNGLIGTNMTNANLNFFSFGDGDVSIPMATMWPTVGGSGGSTLPAVTGKSGSSGTRVFQSGAPGVATTGSTNPTNSRPDLSINVASLVNPVQVFSYFVRKKGVDRTGGTNYNNSAISIPWFTGNSTIFNLAYDQFGSRWWDEVYVGDLYGWPSYPASAATQIKTDTNSLGTTTSWGNSSTGANSPDGSRIVLFDVPVQPMVSLGQFMHLNPFYMFATGEYTALGFGTMFVGGSLPSAEVPLDQTVRDFVPASGNYKYLLMDHSFLANQTLFDSYFFSTVPPSPLPTTVPATTYPAAWTAFNAANTGSTLSDPSKPLLNSRMKPYYRGSTNAPLMADLRDMDKAAANLMLDGAFNINSTSVAAWKAFLSSLSGNDLDIWDASARSSKTLNASTLANPFVRFYAANSSDKVNDLWSGIRSLSDAEITDLATKIVAEVKTRGPFLSMADFLNRRLGASSDLTRAGALQAAIDKTSINTLVKNAGVDVNAPSTLGLTGTSTVYFFVSPISNNMFDASSSTGAIWKTTIGAPGYLMQQDLVQALSPAMTARSDTFVIRTYGEVRNPRTGEVESRAWAEGVVQRTPNLFDASQSAETAQASMNATNQNFGRRFQVVSFRWLNPNEI